VPIELCISICFLDADLQPAVKRGLAWKRIRGMQQRPDLLWIPVILLLHTLSWIPRLQGPLDLRWDGSVYYVLGTSIAQGSGYRLLYEPGAIQATQYPPGLPFIVAAHQVALGTSDPVAVGRALRVTWFVLSSFTAVAVYGLARRYLEPKYAVAAAILYIVQTDGVFLSTLCFGELPFTCLTLLLLVVIPKRETRYRVLAPVLATLAYLIRTQGIAALTAWVADSLFRRRFREAAMRSLIAAIPVVCWSTYTHFVESSEQYKKPAYSYQRADYMFYNVSYGKNLSYRDPFDPDRGRITAQELVLRVLTNLSAIPHQVGQAVSTHQGTWHDIFARVVPSRMLGRALTAVLVCLGLLALGGVLVMGFKGHLVELTYLSVTLLAVSATPWPAQSWRYLYPVSPLLGIALLVALTYLFAAPWAEPSKYRQVFKRVGVAAICGIVTLNIVFLIATYRWYSGEHTLSFRHNSFRARVFFYNDAWRSLDAALHCFSTNYNQTGRVISSAPAWTYLVTGAAGMMPPFVSNQAEAARLMDEAKALYVVVDGVDGGALTKRFAEPVLGRSDWLRICDTPIGIGRVYKRLAD
jgi:hypothetical protein